MELTIEQLREALNELAHLRKFRDHLQEDNTRLVMANRDLKADIRRLEDMLSQNCMSQSNS